MKIIGTGLACLDVIHYESNLLMMNGGTCANVLTVLAQLGESTSILIPEYINDNKKNEFYSTLEKLDVEILFYGKTKQKIPRIVETYNKFEHFFYTKCPKCNKDLVRKRFITDIEAQVFAQEFGKYEVFFTDRVSSGIKEIAKIFNKNDNIVFYEPNSGRNLKSLLEMTRLSNILKVSTDRIGMHALEDILAQCQNSILKIVIATHGEKGLSFCYKMRNGLFSEWIEGPHINFKNVIDTSGAGDWLTAGFLHYWGNNGFKMSREIIYDTLEKALKLSEIASMSCGAQGGFYNNVVLEKLQQEYKVKLLKTLVQSENGRNNNLYCDFCLSERKISK